MPLFPRLISFSFYLMTTQQPSSSFDIVCNDITNILRSHYNPSQTNLYKSSLVDDCCLHVIQSLLIKYGKSTAIVDWLKILQAIIEDGGRLTKVQIKIETLDLSSSSSSTSGSAIVNSLTNSKFSSKTETINKIQMLHSCGEDKNNGKIFFKTSNLHLSVNSKEIIPQFQYLEWLFYWEAYIVSHHTRQPLLSEDDQQSVSFMQGKRHVDPQQKENTRSLDYYVYHLAEKIHTEMERGTPLDEISKRHLV